MWGRREIPESLRMGDAWRVEEEEEEEEEMRRTRVLGARAKTSYGPRASRAVRPGKTRRPTVRGEGREGEGGGETGASPVFIMGNQAVGERQGGKRSEAE